MNPKLLFLIPLLFLVSCNYIQTYFPVNNTITQPIIINSTPTIQNTTIETPPERLMVITQNETNVILLKQNAILVFKDNKTILIDSGTENEVLDVITFLNDLGITELDYIIATTPKSDYIGGIGYLSLRLNPELIYDNGITSDLDSYKLYKRYYNTTSIIHSQYFKDFPMKVLVPFEKGLSASLSDNSLMIEFLEPSVLYMSDCGFECENFYYHLTEGYCIIHDRNCLVGN